ncbi:monovalent cation/H+ antiporter subunit E [Halobellus marinus]|uniref:monovalent cation/H+ antiporter subunit E n=1 Tax=Halobellus TaxID=1073986 RepID=UPI0028B1F946|nr:monovalent cation/H+ antiporter subunit E [Halobellus sp. DFY28]
MGADSARILVPVGESSTLRNTVAYAVREAKAAAEEGAESATVHFVYPARWRSVDGGSADDAEATENLLERVTVWAREDLDDETDAPPSVDIETAVVGIDRYLFSPGDYADMVAAYAADYDLDRVIVDPEFRPGGSAPMLRPFEVELSRTGLSVEEAPVERQTARTRLVSRTTISKGVLTFGLSYAFYLTVAGSVSPFNLATGALTAILAAALFSNVTLVTSPSLRRSTLRTLRMGLFVPYLVWEIIKANLSIAYIILHPDLPIDPEMQRFRAAVWGGLPVTTLANSITLTPGTLTVDVGPEGLEIHTLTGDARDGLAGGSLERAVRFVFYGRGGARIPTPTERESISVVAGAGADETADSAESVVAESDPEVDSTTEAGPVTASESTRESEPPSEGGDA